MPLKARLPLAFILVAALAVHATPQQPCESLDKLKLPAVTITLAQTVPAGPFTPPHGKPTPDLPSFCRIAAASKPSPDSDIQFEVWLPVSGWNGKFQGVGNGGFAGSISYGQMGDAIAHGYATASTDTGHADSGGVTAAWALHHPEKIADFGHRAIHQMTANAKIFVQTYYGQAPKRSYFSSCSNGGRQALMEAQRYPDDYDGIVAGAPANYWTHLLANAAWNVQALLQRPESRIPAEKLPAIQSAALAACDAQDGVKDGVIEDPAHCRFDPGVLKCQGTETNACLTAPQLVAIEKLYSGAHTSDGKQIFPGYSAGGEAEPGGWALWITGSASQPSLMYMFETEFFKNMVYNDPSWDFRTFDVDRDTRTADQKMAQYLNANDPDLGRFKARGGKLILYHGWNDAAIAASGTIDYYRRVVAKMGAAQVRGFVRLFMVPGMQHCYGGAGPDDFGQNGVASGDRDHNVDTALEQWVEGGHAPESIIATKHTDSKTETRRTRPLCAYPSIARYRGSGNTDDAANFVCANPQMNSPK